MSRVFAISDIHIDYKANMQRMLGLSNHDYVDDALILAGDASDSLDRLATLFANLQHKFRHIAFVPGNHELWVRSELHKDSLHKLQALEMLCQDFAVATQPIKVDTDQQAVWLVPLFSWYRQPTEGNETLYIEKTTEDPEKFSWSDDHLCKWPDLNHHACVADYFLSLNHANIKRHYDAPIISFSHFLPRRELMFGSVSLARMYAKGEGVMQAHPSDPHPYFNFSRVAGCYRLDQQIRELGATLHIYGHQHRNRHRKIDGVTYISHCLGNAKEQRYSSDTTLLPKLIWDSNGPQAAHDEL